MDVPLNAHVYQLVTNLSSRPQVTQAKEEESEIAREEIEPKAVYNYPSNEL